MLGVPLGLELKHGAPLETISGISFSPSTFAGIIHAMRTSNRTFCDYHRDEMINITWRGEVGRVTCPTCATNVVAHALIKEAGAEAVLSWKRGNGWIK